MLDIGWTELMVIGILALLVVGPKELPGLFRTVGQYVGRARSVAREFQRSMEDAARDVDGGAFNQIREAKREFDNMARTDFSAQAKKTQESLMSGGKKPAESAAAASKSSATTSTGPSAATAPSQSAASPTPAPVAAAETPAPAAAPAPAATAAPAPASTTASAPAPVAEDKG
ncbi:MAG: Sec-independent protein translocase protein TatB [Pseudomonadota bacterium]